METIKRPVKPTAAAMTDSTASTAVLIMPVNQRLRLRRRLPQLSNVPVSVLATAILMSVRKIMANWTATTAINAVFTVRYLRLRRRRRLRPNQLRLPAFLPAKQMKSARPLPMAIIARKNLWLLLLTAPPNATAIFEKS